MSQDKVPFLESFFKSQFSSIAATAVDFLVLIGLTELLGIFYLISTAIASVAGAIVSFMLGRHWAFRQAHQAITTQALKYALASFSIMLCNVGGMYFFTDMMSIQYIFSKVIVSILVGVFVSFPLFRYFVYK